MPERIQLSRAKGWHLPAHTVVVARPTKWGNPYRLDADHMPWSHFPWQSRERAQACIDHYRRMGEQGFVCIPYTSLKLPDGRESFGAHAVADVAPEELRGKNLACWCALDMPCHADVLLDWANR